MHGVVLLRIPDVIAKQLEVKVSFKLRCIIAISATFCVNGKN